MDFIQFFVIYAFLFFGRQNSQGNALDLYVTTILNPSFLPNDGSLTHPFFSLDEAINAISSSSAPDITLNLDNRNGSHFILSNVSAFAQYFGTIMYIY